MLDTLLINVEHLIKVRYASKMQHPFAYYICLQTEILELEYIVSLKHCSNPKQVEWLVENDNIKYDVSICKRYIANRWLKICGEKSLQAKGDINSIIYNRDNGVCQYCSSSKDIEIHHVVPRAKGGTDSVFNLVCACACCNREIGANICLPRNWWELHQDSRNANYCI